MRARVGRGEERGPAFYRRRIHEWANSYGLSLAFGRGSAVAALGAAVLLALLGTLTPAGACAPAKCLLAFFLVDCLALSALGFTDARGGRRRWLDSLRDDLSRLPREELQEVLLPVDARHFPYTSEFARELARRLAEGRREAVPADPPPGRGSEATAAAD